MNVYPASWIARPDGTGVLPDYRAAISQVVLSPVLLESSTAATKLAILDAAFRAHVAQHGDPAMSNVIELLIGIAWYGTLQNLSSHEGTVGRATERVVAELVVDLPHHDLYSVSPTQHIIILYESMLKRDRRTLRSALWALTDAVVASADPRSDVDTRATHLQGLVAIMVRGAQECPARKRWALGVVVEAAVDTLTAANDRCQRRLLDSVATNHLATTACELPSPVCAAAARLRGAVSRAVDDLKMAALRSAFAEPMKLYFRSIGNAIMEGDVDVHGTNAFAALLRATVGIALPSLSLFEDSVKGIADFRSDALGDEWRAALAAFAKDEVFGMPWTAVVTDAARASTPAIRRGWGGIRINGRASMNVDLFGIGAESAEELGTAAVDSSPLAARVRFRVAPYIAAFTSHLSNVRALERICLELFRDNARAADAQLVLDALPRVPDHDIGCAMPLTALPEAIVAEAALPPVGSDVREYLWGDATELEVTFRASAAQRFLAVLQCAKSLGAESLTGTYESGAAAAAAAAAVRPCASTSRVPGMYRMPCTHTVPLGMSAVALSASGDLRNGRECLANLLRSEREPWSKWLEPRGAWSSGPAPRSAWVVARLPSHGTHIAEYGLCSANDCPERDPIAWTLEGQRVGSDGDWELMHAVDDGCSDEADEDDVQDEPLFSKRYEWAWWQLPYEVACVPMVAVRLRVTRTRGASNSVALQIAHWHLRRIAEAGELPVAHEIGRSGEC